ncbi:hypothetical protein FACS1894174_05120 [Bacteroidia bacterium]|nr:hypothetical protein FACS1894174_05120 [Bacteroidia bacterium]
MFLPAGLSSLQAQTVSWSTGYPELSPATLTVLDDPGYLDVYFTPTVADIATAKLEVTLPTGISYGGIENGTGHTGSITYGTPAVSGQKVTVSFTSNSNTLKVNEAVFVRLKVSAACSAVSGSTATVKVLSNTTLVTGGEKNVTIGVQVPNIRVQSDAPVQNYTDQNDEKYFELKLDAQNGEASSFIVTLTASQYATFSDFTLDGAPITPTSNAISGTSKVAKITLNTATNMSGKLGSTPKILKFKAGTSRCGSRPITTSVQYPAASNCVTQAGTTLTMNIPGAAGLPTIKYISTTYLKPDLTDGTVWDIPLDGTTPSFLRQIYTNIGSADAYDLTIRFSNETNVWAYVDVNNIYYKIGKNGTEYQVPANLIRTINTLATTVLTFKIKPGLVGKPTDVNIPIPEVLAPGDTLYMRNGLIQGAIFDNTTDNGNRYIANCCDRIYGYGRGASASNVCGEAGGGVNHTYESFKSHIYFRELPPSISIRANQSVTKKIYIRPGYDGVSPAEKNSFELFVQLPDFMTLDGGGITDAIKICNVAETSFVTPIATTDHTNGLYSFQFNAISSGHEYLILNLKSGTCQGASANETGTVTCRFDFHPGDGSNPQRPTMEAISRINIPVTLLCKEDGVVLEDFYLTRLTRGLKDADNDGYPDDGTIAPENQSGLLHTRYMSDDEGRITYKGRIAGASSDTYKNFYCLLDMGGYTMEATQDLIPPSGVMVKIGATEYPATLGYSTDYKKFYVLYSDATTSIITGGKTFEVNVDFKVRTPKNAKSSFTAEAYVSNQDETDPFSPADRHGEDVMTYEFETYPLWFVRYEFGGPEGVFKFTNNNSVIPGGKVMDLGRNTIPPPPYFPNEYRPFGPMLKETVNLPEGYIIDNLLTSSMRHPN